MVILGQNAHETRKEPCPLFVLLTVIIILNQKRTLFGKIVSRQSTTTLPNFVKVKFFHGSSK